MSAYQSLSRPWSQSPRPQFAKTLVLSLLTIGLLSGCGSKLADVSDNELADQMHACRTDQDPSPGRAIACDNYKRECDRRRKEGRFVC